METDTSCRSAVDDAVSLYTPFSHLAGGPFIMPFPFQLELRAFTPSAVQDGAPAPPPTEFATWQIDGEIFYSLCCIQDPVGPPGKTVMILYDHETATLHYLRRDLWIPDCPADTVLLAHFIWDQVGGGASRPNFLLFDAVQWQGKKLAGAAPRERYARLRSLKLGEGSIISLQFVGEQHAVQGFVSQTKLPHSVKRCITLTADPLRPVYVPGE